jgi:3-hydroxybutyryl-CoA dehydrogenase
MSATRALVVGGGVMARGIAAALAASGIHIAVLVRRREVVAETQAEIGDRTGRICAHGGGVVSVHASVGDLEPPFGLAVESVAEELEAKCAVLAGAERLLADDGILTTNTSSLPLSELGRSLVRPERFAGWHWFNPAELVPLVEVVAAPPTAPAVVERLLALSRTIGKEPVAVRRDVPGFVANRLQYALLREAYALVESGVCDVDDVDRAVVAGVGARWAAIGPFASMDAAGLEVHEAVAAQLFPRLSRSTAVPALLRDLRRRGATGARGGIGLRGTYGPGAARRLAEQRDATLALLGDARRESPA